MKYVKAALVGIVGSLVMFVLMMIGIHGTGIAPFNIPPSAAFLVKFDIAVQPLALLVHFGYGAFWSIILIVATGNHPSIGKGLLLSIVLWLIMMVIYSPIIGWGFFGFADTSGMVDKLQLEQGPKYLVMTLVLHLLYGATIGWLNAVWRTSDE